MRPDFLDAEYCSEICVSMKHNKGACFAGRF